MLYLGRGGNQRAAKQTNVTVVLKGFKVQKTEQRTRKKRKK